MDVIKEKQDLTWLKWSKIRNSSGTAGSFYKAYSETDGKKIYYKLSNYENGNGVVGYESVLEIIVGRLLDYLEIEHLKYELVHADILIGDKKIETWVCKSADFKKASESKVSLEDYYDMEKLPGESPIEFCKRMGWEEWIYDVLIVDFLIQNRDRHGANIEVLRSRKDMTIRLAPIFDNGLCFCFSCHKKSDIENFDVLEDRKIQSFIGGNSSLENLKLIPPEKRRKLPIFDQKLKEMLFKDLEDCLQSYVLEKIWQMLVERRNQYEALGDL